MRHAYVTCQQTFHIKFSCVNQYESMTLLFCCSFSYVLLSSLFFLIITGFVASPCVHCCQDTCPTIGESQGQSLCSLSLRHMPYHWGKPGSVLVSTVVKTPALPLGKARVSLCVHGCQDTSYHWGKPGSVLVSMAVKTHPTTGESQGQSLCPLLSRHMPYHWGKPGSVLVSMAVKTHALPLGKARVSPCVHCCQGTCPTTVESQGQSLCPLLSRHILPLGFVCWLVGCSTSQQQASVSQGRICSDNCTCCHTEIKVADPTFYLIQSQYTDTGPTSPNADPITPGAWQGSHWSANF